MNTLQTPKATSMRTSRRFSGLLLQRCFLFAVFLLAGFAHGQTPGTYIDLFDFNLIDGRWVTGPVTFDSAGNMYGTVGDGGANNYGLVFEITTAGVYRDLHDFGGTIVNANGTTGQDGFYPVGGVTFDKHGNMFGITEQGGPASGGLLNNGGMVWEITAGGVYKDLHDFGGQIINAEGVLGQDGFLPNGGLIFDQAGNMYGTTQDGGAYTTYFDLEGLLFEITPSGQYLDLHDFGGTGVLANGTIGITAGNPTPGIAIDASGNIYGTGGIGGPQAGQNGASGNGCVWEYTTQGFFRDLHDFGGTITTASGVSGPDGFQPTAGVTFDAAGNLYGTVQYGATNNGGLLWEITTGGVYKDLHDFFGSSVAYASGANGYDGKFPASNVVFDGAGNMYGTALNGGTGASLPYGALSNEGGILWEIPASGTYRIIHAFGANVKNANGTTGYDGQEPIAVTLDAAGNLYGGTQMGGPYGVPIYDGGGPQPQGYGMVWEIFNTSLSAVSVTPTSVSGGTPSTGKVTLTYPAPPGGSVVSLSSNNVAATVPATVTVATGATSATFTIGTTGVASNTSVTISAQLVDITESASLTIIASGIQSLGVSPSAVNGGLSSTGTVKLTTPAPAGGASITLSSNNASATVPVAVVVPAGSTSATFTVGTTTVTTSTSATITATYNGTATATLTIDVNDVLVGLVLSPSELIGGVSSTGTVTLSGPAGSGGVVVQLSSTYGASCPSSVTIPAGATTGTFTISTVLVASSITSTITAASGGLTFSTPLTIHPTILSNFQINPTVVAAGSSATGTISISSAAPTGGSVVNIVSSNTAATVPATVTIPAGATSATFTISTSSVSTAVSFTIAASQGHYTFSAPFEVQPNTSLSSLTLSPTSVGGGASTTGTVTLTHAAPTGGVTVSLTSNSTYATVPATVTVAAGNTSANFTVSTSGVGTTTSATITAQLSSVSKTATLTIQPPTLSTVTVSPVSIPGGATATGTVTLTGPAPTSGLIVTLTSSSSAATVPVSVEVFSGSSSASFVISTTGMSSSVNVTITGTLNGTSKTGTLTVQPAGLLSVSVAQPSVLGGNQVNGSVTLSANAPAGGTLITLSSNTSSATVPASVLVPAGLPSYSFTILTTAVSSPVVATIKGTLGTNSQTATLTITLPTLSYFGVTPASVPGGTSSVGSVTLASAAGPGGVMVSLSSNSSSASVPATMTVAAGQITGTFTVNTSGVASTSTATITATQGSISKTTTLTITPAVLVSLSIVPSTITGGTSAIGTVTVNGTAGPGGSIIFLSSNSTNALTPISVTIPAGSSTGTFTLTTTSPASSVTARILGTQGSTTMTELVTVNPAPALTLSLSPSSVIGGTSVTGTVTIGSPAPTGGVIVALSASNGYASLPSSVMIAAGATSASFTITTLSVGAPITSTITAKVASQTSSATLTINQATLENLSVSPYSVVGGASITGTVTLSAPAPVGGSVIQLSVSSTSASVPASVTVPQGATSATFIISTAPVSTSIGVNVTAVQGRYTFQVAISILK